MSTTTSRIIRPTEYISPTRRAVMGIVFLVMAFGIWLLFSIGTAADVTTAFVLYPGGSKVVVSGKFKRSHFGVVQKYSNKKGRTWQLDERAEVRGGLEGGGWVVADVRTTTCGCSLVISSCFWRLPSMHPSTECIGSATTWGA